MGFLRKRGPKPAEITQYTGLQIQTSSSAVPITISYGINKLAPNLLWYGAFGSTPEYTKSGGKGGGKKTLSGYNYTAALTLGLCEGPITAVGTIWKDQGVYSLSSLNLNLEPGNAASPTLAYLSDVTYKGVATVWSALYDLGSSASLGALQFEIYGQKYATAVVNAHDADPAEVIYDFLTNAQYGVGFPAGSIDSTALFGASGGASYQAYCMAAQIAFSPVLANRETASAILTRWLQLTNSTAVWSDGKLKFVSYGDATIDGTLYDGSAVSFVPNLVPIYDLTDDDYVREDDEDPVSVEVNDPYSAFNVQELEFSDRKNKYNSTTITTWDQNAIEQFGRRDASTVTAHEICDKAMAQTIAQLILQREVYIRNTYAFKLSFEFCLLEPMDIVTLTDTGLGLDKLPVRIVSIDEDDDGLLSVSAEEFPASTGTSAVYQVQGNEAVSVDWNVVPSSVNPPVIFEPPSGLTNGQREVWVAVSGGLETTRRLEEDGSTGYHYATWTFPSALASRTIYFAAYVKASERTACGLQIYDGAASQGVSFNLATGLSQGASSGVTTSWILDAGSGWYQVGMACVVAASVAPIVTLLLQSPAGTSSYAGTSGNGIFVWQPQYAEYGQSLSAIATSATLLGSTFDTDAQDPPTGAEGTKDPYWGGCIIYVSTDNATYGQVGQVNGPSRHGTTTAALGSADTTISVSLVESGGTLDPATAADAANGVTLSLVEDELIAYASATLTGTNAYGLGGLVRGLYETNVPASHPIGSRFARLDNAIFKYPLAAAYVGQAIYIKFQSFNIFGLGVQDLATCATYTYTPNGAGGGLGSILQQLALGIDVDLGLVTDAVTVEEDLGVLASSPDTTVDLGSIA
jgi:hypothetical protein